jgi:hypothetical protein
MKETFDPFVESVARGPRGGNLDAQTSPAKPEWRKTHLNGEVLPNGGLALHRFEKQEITVPGKKNEQPWHRMAAYMLNVGRTNSEIALAADVDPATVAQLRGQRWFQELCATIANEHGEALIGAIQSEAMDSLNTIVDLRDNSESDRVRLSAATTILEQAHGKPVQKIVSDISHRVATSPTEEMEAIQAELAALRAKPIALPPPMAAGIET